MESSFLFLMLTVNSSLQVLCMPTLLDFLDVLLKLPIPLTCFDLLGLSDYDPHVDILDTITAFYYSSFPYFRKYPFYCSVWPTMPEQIRIPGTRTCLKDVLPDIGASILPFFNQEYILQSLTFDFSVFLSFICLL